MQVRLQPMAPVPRRGPAALAHPAATRHGRLLGLQRQAGNAVVVSALAVQRACCSSCAGGGTCESDTTEPVQRQSRTAVQRAVGDGHDLRAARFSGDTKLEAVFDDEDRLRPGQHGEPARKVQQALKDVTAKTGNTYDLGTSGPNGDGVDGQYGSKTSAAVQKFKADESLGSLTAGDVGPGTIGRLDQHLADGVVPPPPVDLLRSPRFVLDTRLNQVAGGGKAMRRGEKGEPVRLVQRALVDTGFPLPKGGADADFGGETEGAVKAFQRAFQLPRVGIVDATTLRTLDNLVSGQLRPSGEAAGDITPGPQPAVARNLTASERRLVDRRLLQSRETIGFARAKLVELQSARPLVASNPQAFLLFHGATHTAVKRWLRVFDPRVQAYWDSVASAIALFGRHMAISVEESIRRHPFPDPERFCPNVNTGAATAGTRIGLCSKFFADGATCQRDELTHEIFHSIGVHHGGPLDDPTTPFDERNTCVARTAIGPAQALDSCDNLAMLASEISTAAFDACGPSCFGDAPPPIPDDLGLLTTPAAGFVPAGIF